ncbi:imelysin family protein [Fulvivirga ligni]|uniref:imelysin family protein n=1 Tax=Fulvivirga ligni TaxID=2904246 RepID=UPI001F343915|nr:imelysin family protein [Fulvivirga ligni]UII19829.1 imelysin family protein [Fulvivirga ligni]
MMNYFKRGLLMVAFLGALLTFSGCGDENSDETDNFDRSLLLSQASLEIVTGYEELANNTASLENSVTVFVATPNEDNLVSVQNAWKAARKSYKQVELFDFGPVEQLGIMTSFDSWPTNSANIESTLSTDQTIDVDYVKNLGASTKGFPAIEYLIFAEEQSNAELVDEFTNNQNRKDFLAALATSLNNIAQQAFQAWTSAGSDYSATFIIADGKDVGSSTNVLANKFIQLIEVIKNNKVGIPLGKKSMGTPLPENVESPKAKISLDLIEVNLISLQTVFTGGSQPTDMGFDDYLNAVGAQYDGESLSGVIENQIAKCLTDLEAIKSPLKEAVSDEVTEVDALYNDLQQLTIYVKTDMMSSLGLLVTFSDNDGD